MVVLGGTCRPGAVAGPLPSRPGGGACTCQPAAGCWALAGATAQSDDPRIDATATTQHRRAAALRRIRVVCILDPRFGSTRRGLAPPAAATTSGRRTGFATGQSFPSSMSRASPALRSTTR